MRPVTIYTKPWCGYCSRARALLERKGVGYEEIDVSRDADREREMVERSGGRFTVPQVFVGDVHVGGCDELHALEAAGRLDPLLASADDGR